MKNDLQLLKNDVNPKTFASNQHVHHKYHHKII